jgi:two-component system sensor histidine kinase GlrK
LKQRIALACDSVVQAFFKAMMKFSIFQRLTTGYIIIFIMVSSFGGYVAYQLNRLTEITKTAAETDSDAIQAVKSLTMSFPLLVASEKKFWISHDKDFLGLFEKRKKDFLRQQKNLQNFQTADSSTVQLITQISKHSQEYFQLVDKHLKAKRGIAVQERDHSRNQIVQLISKSLDKLMAQIDQDRDKKILQSKIISARVYRVTGLLAAIVLVVSIIVSSVTTHSIIKPIQHFQKQTREIANGRFVKVEDPIAPPEIRQLAEDFNHMSERLAELDTMKEDFISHLSHSLRTPLTAIWEASKMLINGTFDQRPDKRGQLLVIIRDECENLIVSVNRILDLSRMESSMMDYKFESIDISDLVQSSIFKLSPIAQSKNIRLKFNAAESIPLVRGDGNQLKQLLENLIGNALKYTTDETGLVEITVSTNTSKTAKEGKVDQVLVAIKDTGCGIEEKYLDNIFDRFRRIEHGQNTIRGTGLGLAIAKHIVTAHGGDLWVESEFGKGSVFYFTIPCA